MELLVVAKTFYADDKNGTTHSITRVRKTNADPEALPLIEAEAQKTFGNDPQYVECYVDIFPLDKLYSWKKIDEKWCNAHNSTF